MTEMTRRELLSCAAVSLKPCSLYLILWSAELAGHTYESCSSNVPAREEAHALRMEADLASPAPRCLRADCSREQGECWRVPSPREMTAPPESRT